MPVNTLSMDMLNASQLAYKFSDGSSEGERNRYIPDEYILDTDFFSDGHFKDPNTGFEVVALKNAATGEYILAFTGTQPGAQDWQQNLKLGWNEWEANAERIRQYINDISNNSNVPFNKIHFTGHSLGGALAQYAAYDYASDIRASDPTASLPVGVSLTTFNGLGGQDGLIKYNSAGDVNQINTIISGINAHHYFVTGDLVSQLGGGHLGGNTYEWTLSHNGQVGEFDFATAHVMDSLYQFVNGQGGIFDTFSSTPNDLEISNAQGLAAFFCQLPES